MAHSEPSGAGFSFLAPEPGGLPRLGLSAVFSAAAAGLGGSGSGVLSIFTSGFIGGVSGFGSCFEVSVVDLTGLDGLRN